MIARTQVTSSLRVLFSTRGGLGTRGAARSLHFSAVRLKGRHPSRRDSEICYACGQQGHRARECQAHVTKKLNVKTGERLLHRPVLVNEILASFQPEDGKTFIDATFGGGGHTRELLKTSGTRVYALDRDPTAIEIAESFANESNNRVVPMLSKFSEIVEKLRNIDPVDGILFDLGVSSAQLNTPERGFSFMIDGPLDMRMGGEKDEEDGKLSAADVVNCLNQIELAKVIKSYGDERYGVAIAEAIVKHRQQYGPILRTEELARIVQDATPFQRSQATKINAATQTFMALRVFVNDEINEIAQGLDSTIRLLKPGGQIIVLSFQPQEDRLVKSIINQHCAGGELRKVSKKVIRATDEEVKSNPRARSVRMRVAIKV